MAEVQDECVKEQHARAMAGATEYYDNRPKSFKELFERLGKWLFLPRTDYIEVILATVISNRYKDGSPLFTFIMSPSGDAKSTIVKALEGLPNYKVKRLDRITKNTFASGMTMRTKGGKLTKVHDLGDDLQDTSTILLVPDLACMTSLRSDDKKEIWGTFRTLYDGDITKDTGSGVQTMYSNCHVTIIACSTTALKSEVLIHQHLGSRELIYETPTNKKHNSEKMKMSRRNFRRHAEMKKDIRYLIQSFIAGKKFNNDYEIPDHIFSKIEAASEKLAVLRAHAPADYRSQYKELNEDVSPEVPVRLCEQLQLMYYSLHSLDPDYPDKNFLRIMERMVYSSSNAIRYKIYNYFEKNKKSFATTGDLHAVFKVGPKPISGECEALVNIGVLDKEVREDMLFGRIIDKAYYSWHHNSVKQKEINF